MRRRDAASGSPQRRPQWLAALRRRCHFLWWEESGHLRLAHGALVDLHAIAQNHLTLPSAKSATEVRSAHDRAVFLCERLSGRYVEDIRDVALNAIYRCAEVLNPAVDLDADNRLHLRNEMEQAKKAAHDATLNHLKALMTGTVRRSRTARTGRGRRPRRWCSARGAASLAPPNCWRARQWPPAGAGVAGKGVAALQIPVVATKRGPSPCHDALSHLHSAAQHHLTRPSIENRVALRAAYEATVFHAKLLEDFGVRAIALSAAEAGAEALGMGAGGREQEVLPVRHEVERAHEDARRAMLDYLDDLITGNA